MSKPDAVEAIVRERGPLCAKDVYEACDILTSYTDACGVLNTLRKRNRVEVVGKDARDRMLYAVPGADVAVAAAAPPARRAKAAAAPAAADVPQTHCKNPAHQVAPPGGELMQAHDPNLAAWISINERGQLQIGGMPLSREQTHQLGQFLRATERIWDSACSTASN